MPKGQGSEKRREEDDAKPKRRRDDARSEVKDEKPANKRRGLAGTEGAGTEGKRKRERKPRRRREPEPIVRRKPGEPGPARLYALLAGAGLSLLGVLGFFFDAGFGTGSELDGDDIAGILIVNGWRNTIYLVSGLLALAFAASRPRLVSFALAVVYLALGIAGAANTNADIGSLFDALPLTNEDNVFHLAIGALGLIAFLADGSLKRQSKARARRRKRANPRKRAERPETASTKARPGREDADPRPSGSA